jgi:N-methylhydantoinase A
MGWRVGIDSGGTFTDICLFDEMSGRLATWKVPSTPADPSIAIAQGALAALARHGASPDQVSYFGHGTTVGTNALIQHKGAKVGLITTEGFRDLLEIGRQKRPDLYDPHVEKPPTLVPRSSRLEVAERVRHDGRVETPLDHDGVQRALDTLRSAGVEAVAVCFLYSYLRPAHEEAVAAMLRRALPEAFASISHDVSPEFREFERLSTTVVNAYLGPVMERYLRRLLTALREAGVAAAPRLTLSNGGVANFADAQRLPARTILSGPATGVVGASRVGEAAGYRDLITFDMGGTSTDVALISAGQCREAAEASVHGYPIKAPMLDIHTVGAGGGSIAFVDSGGLLKVGPASAGADPGPACYALGNQEPTVTDANMVLGVLNPTALLGGRMAVDASLSHRAVGRVAERLGIDTLTAAQGIIAVVTSNMARAIRVISVRKGYDPRRYTLMAFGGAGPLHAASLARELEMPRVLVPRNPGILCAMGLLMTDLRADFAASRILPWGVDSAAGIMAMRERLLGLAEAWFAEQGVAERATALVADLRYAGQNHELSVDIDDLDSAAAILETGRRRFMEAHARAYGFAPEDDPIELVTLRARAIGGVPKARVAAAEPGGVAADAARIGARRVYFGGAIGFAECPLFDRDLLRPGNVITGPAIVEQMDSTTLLPPRMTATVDAFANILLEDA